MRQGTNMAKALSCLLLALALQIPQSATDDFPLSDDGVFNIEFDDDDDIDDSLLDNLFENLPDEEENAPRLFREFTVTSRTPHSFISLTFPVRRPTFDLHCLLGGRDALGPINKVGILPIFPSRFPAFSHRFPWGQFPAIPQRFPSGPLAPFPDFMTRGDGRTFSRLLDDSVYTCTPAYPTTSKAGIISYVPGSCHAYNFQTGTWSSTGGHMKAYRQGGSIAKVGRYLLAFGGTEYPGSRPVRSVEVLDLRRPGHGWDTVPQWEANTADMDHCTVVAKHPKLGPIILQLGGGRSPTAVHQLSLATNSWSSLEPMLVGRSQHACTPITINNSPGIVVSGGSNLQSSNLTSVEFYDLSNGYWVSLPSLGRGRRGHAMAAVASKLTVLGGSSTGLHGQVVVHKDLETFTGRQWRKAGLEMDRARDGVNMVRIPKHLIDTSQGRS